MMKSFVITARKSLCAALILSVPMFANADFPGRGGGGRGTGPGRAGPQQPGPRPGRPGPEQQYPGPRPGPRRPPQQYPDRFPPRFPQRPQPRPPQPWPGEALLEVYTSYGNGYQYLSLDPNEGVQSGYQPGGVAFRAFQQNNGRRVVITRCYSPTFGYFASAFQNCEGFQATGFLGFLQPYAGGEAGFEVVRCTNGYSRIVTMNRSDCLANGYGVEAVLGYTP
jgi:hypothetical protein